VGVRPNEIGVRRINFEHFELLGGFARLRVQLQLIRHSIESSAGESLAFMNIRCFHK